LYNPIATEGGAYVAASAIDFAGDYEGDAAKITAIANQYYHLPNPYSVEKLNALKKFYTHVSLWICIAFMMLKNRIR
jgi:hypothetical protein